MDPSYERAARLFNLADEAFFEFDTDVGGRLELALSDLPFEGIILRAPKSVPLGERATLPGLLASQYSDARNWAVVFRRNTVLVAVDLQRGSALVRNLFETHKRRDPASLGTSREGPAPTDVAAEALTTSVRRLDLRDLGGVPWEPGRWAFTVLSHDWVSETIVITLTAPDGARAVVPRVPRDEAEALAAQAAEARAHPGSIPSFEADYATPQLAQIGAVLKVPSDAFSGAPLVIRGAIGVPVDASSLVDTSGGDPFAPLPAAVLRGTVVLCRLDDEARLTVDVRVPVFSSAPLRRGETVTAAFAIDVSASLEEPLELGEWCVHFFTGPYHAGPYRLIMRDGDIPVGDTIPL